MNSVNFGANQFCGPSVISAIAGINTDEAVAVVISTSDRKRKIVTGLYMYELKAAFKELGFECSDVIPSARTVFGCLYSISRSSGNGYYVFMVPGHFIAIELNGEHKFICDNRSKTPVNAAASSRLGMKVNLIIKVTKK